MSGSGDSRSSRKVVISSVTGKPIPWEEQGPAPEHVGPDPRPIVPDRVEADAPEPGTDESNDARLSGDVPPHWGR